MSFNLLKIWAITGLLWVWLPGQSQLELYGYGMRLGPSDISSRGMGGITIIPGSSSEPLYSNPASWYRADNTHLNIALGHSRTAISGNDDLYRTRFQGLNFIAHTNNRTAWGIGLEPYSRMNLAGQDTVDTVLDSGDSLQYAERRISIGGISTLRMGYSRKIADNVSVGVNLLIQFGTITDRDTIAFLETGRWDDELGTSLVSERRSEFSGKMLDLALLWDNPFERPGQLGLKMTWPLSLSAVNHTALPGIISESKQIYRDMVQPATFNLGFGYDLTARQRLAGEYSRMANFGADQGQELFSKTIERANAFRLGWTFYTTRTNAINTRKLFYRLGLKRESYYLYGSGNTPWIETGITLGLGLPYARSHRVDLSVELGSREDLNSLLPKEDFLIFSLGITTGELWFARQKKEWD